MATPDRLSEVMRTSLSDESLRRFVTSKAIGGGMVALHSRAKSHCNGLGTLVAKVHLAAKGGSPGMDNFHTHLE